jgi:hypothetical protein
VLHPGGGGEFEAAELNKVEDAQLLSFTAA